MRDEGLANWLADNGLGRNAESSSFFAKFEARETFVHKIARFHVKQNRAIVKMYEYEIGYGLTIFFPSSM